MARVPVPSAPFVGRTTEMDELAAGWEQARGGAPEVVLLSGEAGVGKSRLIAEIMVLAAGSGATVLTGTCLDAAEAHLPYLPFTEVVDGMRAVRPGLAEEFPALAPLLAGDGPATGAMGQLPLFDAVHRALLAVGAAPTLLVVEDLHWADRSSRDLLAFLLSRPLGPHLMLIVSHRSDLPRAHPLRPLLAQIARRPVVRRIELAPLDGAHALGLVRGLAPAGTSEEVLRAVAERSEGNPFFAEELLAAGTSGGPLPELLGDVLLANVERLAPATQRLVRLASVAGGRWVRHDRLRAAAGLPDDDLDAAVREALDQHVLVPLDPSGPAGYAFRHALLGEALYADLVPGERARWHAAFATAAEHDPAPGAAAELAYHLGRGPDQAGAYAASVRAARESADRGAPADALWHAEQALRLADLLPSTETGADERALRTLAAGSAALAGEPGRAVRHAEAAVALADGSGDPVARAQARCDLVQLVAGLPGGAARAHTAALAARALLDGPPVSAMTVWAEALVARTFLNLGDFAEADRHAGQALELAPALDPDAAGAAVDDARITRSAAVDITGRHAEAEDLLVAAERDAAARGDAEVALRAAGNRGLLRYRAAELAGAVAAFEQAASRAAASGLTWSLYGVQSRMMLDVVRGMTGDWAPVLAGRDERSVAAALPVLVAAGRTEEADRHLAALAEQPAGTVDEDTALLGGVAGCERELWRGRPDAAAAWIDRALAGLDAAGSSWQVARIRPAALGLTAAADTAEGARRGGTPVDQARGDHLHALAHASAASVVRPLGPEALAWLAWADAEHTRLSGRVDDVGGWRAVVAAFGYGDAYPQACARRRFAAVLLATGERDAAAGELREALATAERLGAVPLAEAVRATARHGGLRLGGEQAPPSGLLTPRERSVLTLVADGGTNRQVGEALYISEKTVSVHLTRVMAKLGAANRTEAVRIAYERGLLATTPPVRTPR